MNVQTSVGEQLQQMYRLRVLRITLDATDPVPLAVFSLSLFTSPSQCEEVAVLTATMPELGLEGYQAGVVHVHLPQAFTLPSRIVEALQGWLSIGPDAGQPLWLRLTSPLGLLPAIAWEELLQPKLHVPVLRLPYHAICPRIPARGIDTVICFSTATDEPEVRSRIREFVEHVPLDFARASNFHLFADARAYEYLVQLEREFGDQVRINVYEPLPVQAIPRDSERNPWLAWIKETVAKSQQHSVDIVHFLCHSEHSADQGRLVLRSEPRADPSETQRMELSAAEIVTFLNDVGAWCVAFTSALNDRTAGSMRLLQTQIAMLRPGPVLVHDMKVKGSREGLAEAYRFLLRPDHPVPNTAALSLCCHPVLVTAANVDAESYKQLSSYTLADKVTEFYQDLSPPAWLGAVQRKMEMEAGELADETDPAVISGQQSAREVLLDAVSDYVKSTIGRDPVAGGDHGTSSHRS